MNILSNGRLTRSERKALILRQARRVFAAKGYACTRITDIVEATAVSQGLLYVYFESKEALFTELLRMSFERINSALTELEQMPLSARDRIVMALTRIVTGFGRDVASKENVLLIAQASFSEGIPDTARKLLISGQREPCAALARILAEGQKEGTVRDLPLQELAALLWSTMKGLALDEATLGHDFQPPDVHTIANLYFG